jgi:hypothetical protein
MTAMRSPKRLMARRFDLSLPDRLPIRVSMAKKKPRNPAGRKGVSAHKTGENKTDQPSDLMVASVSFHYG